MLDCPYDYKNFILNSGLLYHLTAVEGLDDAEIREARENRAAQHGQTDYNTLLGSRLITLKGEIIASSISQRNQARQTLLDTFVKDGSYSWLKWQPTGDSIAKQIYCKVFSRGVDDNLSGSDSLARDFLINLLAVDPLIYSQTEQIININIASSAGGFASPLLSPLDSSLIQTGGRATCNNEGNFECLPTVKMYGPLTNPRIKNNTDDSKEIKVNIEVDPGNYLEIDFKNKTIMLNGVTSMYAYKDNTSLWFAIKPGNNDIEFRDGGGDPTGYCQVIFRSSWN